LPTRVLTSPDSSHSHSKADKAALTDLLMALEVSPLSSLRRDSCGNWTIVGHKGTIVPWGEDLSFQIFLQCSSKRQWSSAKRQLSFLESTQDGDDEGCFRLTELPNAEQAKTLRKQLGLRKRPRLSTERREALSHPLNVVALRENAMRAASLALPL
jgi:hypothetical protein